jgi:hypothetical protein
MTDYTKKDLELLKTWITTKLDSMTKCTTPLEQYSETNLSRAILKFIQHLMDKEHQKLDNQSYYSPDPYISSYNLSPSSPSYGVTWTTNTDTICAQCKAANPSCTHCIHRVTGQLTPPLKY